MKTLSQRAAAFVQQIENRGTTIDMAGIVAFLRDVADAPGKISDRIRQAGADERYVDVDGLPVFFSRAGDDVTDTHTLTPCPHCGGSGTAEDCEQPSSKPYLLTWTPGDDGGEITDPNGDKCYFKRKNAVAMAKDILSDQPASVPVARVVFTSRSAPDVEWLVDTVKSGTELFAAPDVPAR
jgi:hypothetical protein